ncbi:hypothetical protein EQZ23_07000 [Sphingomonas sp. UV9]|uniref:hypothetical protein n=1 Tax=Sphingomonas sp. UV9 TaxID=1851410 RepID=UPI000FFB3E22|nr:hypothetical protein [Sphingomonas sp. UV9]RXD04880.1 hypothetical protein EQZ23_07000 [Sphingomonas sp. UV9]
MNEDDVKERLEAALESLARIEHERWAHWQRYMHSKSELRADGSMLVPAELVAKWSKQIDTAYDDLDLDEQQSDQDQVRRYLPTVVKAITRD